MTSGQGKKGKPVAVVMNMFHTGRRIACRPGEIPSFRIIPELTISPPEIDKAIDVMDEALAEAGTGKSRAAGKPPCEASDLRLIAVRSRRLAE